MKAYLKVFLVIFLLSVIIEESPAAKGPVKADAGPKGEFLTEVVKPLTTRETGNKITVVGAGNVGMAVVLSLLTQYITDEIVIIDTKKDRVEGEIKDLQDGTAFIRSPKISGGSDYTLTKNSRICIVTAGVNQAPGEKREALVQRNLKIFQDIIPKLIEHNPNAVLLIVTNPVDVMTYITWHLVGRKNTNKVLGSGTNLDSSRLRFLISQDLDISPESVHGWVIGGHGDGSVTAWSGVNIAGANIRSMRQADKTLASKLQDGEKGEDWFVKTHKAIVERAYEVIKLKGSTAWAVGLSVANLAHSILHNTANIHAVSTLAKGFHGITDDVFLSLPCVLGENGVTRVIQQPLEGDEMTKLQQSARDINEIIKSLNLKVEGQKEAENKN